VAVVFLSGDSIENVVQHFQRETAKIKTVTLKINGRVTKK